MTHMIIEAQHVWEPHACQADNISQQSRLHVGDVCSASHVFRNAGERVATSACRGELERTWAPLAAWCHATYATCCTTMAANFAPSDSSTCMGDSSRWDNVSSGY